MGGQHRLTITHTHEDGRVERGEMTAAGSAVDAHAARISRLRGAETPHESGPGWIEFTDRVNGGRIGDTYEPGFEYRTRLEYTDEHRGGVQ